MKRVHRGYDVLDSPVVIGGSAGVRCHSEAADAVPECESSVSITGLTYTCSGPSTPHLSSACSLPSLLSHDNDSVVRCASDCLAYCTVVCLELRSLQRGEPLATFLTLKCHSSLMPVYFPVPSS